MTSKPINGGEALVRSLELEGVDVMFGLPGGAILPVYDPIIDSSIRHVLVRHEQGAGHMAQGYAHATGRPGVAMVTSGPAATNIVTPLLDAAEILSELSDMPAFARAKTGIIMNAVKGWSMFSRRSVNGTDS